MEKMIDLECEICKKQFKRRLTEYKRNVSRKNKILCSKKCNGFASFYKIKNHPKRKLFNGCKKGEMLDEFSPFRRHMKQCKSRNRELDIDLEYLKELWEKQNGICPYTNFKMENPSGIGVEYNPKNKLMAASLDRIDSNKGYIKGNVEFVCRFIQYGKNSSTKQEVEDFIKLLKSN